jgi:hypothetical protein
MTEGDERVSAEYLAARCVELAQQAKRSGFRTGAYLLKMACLEFYEQQDRVEQDPKNVA